MIHPYVILELVRTQVRMGLSKQTVDKVTELTGWLGTANRADTVVHCISVAALVFEAVREGKTVKFVDADGYTETLTFPDGATE